MQVARWGNSLAVRLPAELVRELGLTPESLAELLKGIRKSPVETFKNNTEKTEDESDENN